ncbi:AAA family ATPase [Miltoncostaea marina]|uniref:AAA family ATPase n=1 Tax=Miltoncostaea marina TaxID=2843215 RepID=UPI001C3E7854|nr:hypothetical protein [Miltoncostaea marina]
MTGGATSGARLVAVLAASGGCGASLVAGGIAIAWSRTGAASWLVELDLDRGDLAEAWSLPEGPTVADLAVVADELEARHVRQAAHRHASGVWVVAAAPDAGGAWRPPALGRLADAARGAAGDGGRVAIDAGTGAGERAVAIAARADGVLVVCGATLQSARRARRVVEALRAAGAPAPGLVVARGAAPSEIGARALGRAIGATLVGELPWSAREASALGAGRWPGGRRRRLACAVEGLAGAVG